jgi:hypothetical protein
VIIVETGGQQRKMRSVEIAEFSNSMGKINEGEHSDRAEEDDDMNIRSEDEGLTAVQKGQQKTV